MPSNPPPYTHCFWCWTGARNPLDLRERVSGKEEGGPWTNWLSTGHSAPLQSPQHAQSSVQRSGEQSQESPVVTGCLAPTGNGQLNPWRNHSLYPWNTWYASPRGPRVCHGRSSHLASQEPNPEALEAGRPWPVIPHLIVQCHLQSKEIPAEPSRQSVWKS